MKKKLFVKTHGCQMNEYDSAKMIDLLQEKEDFELAESGEAKIKKTSSQVSPFPLNIQPAKKTD